MHFETEIRKSRVGKQDRKWERKEKRLEQAICDWGEEIHLPLFYVNTQFSSRSFNLSLV